MRALTLLLVLIPSLCYPQCDDSEWKVEVAIEREEGLFRVFVRSTRGPTMETSVPMLISALLIEDDTQKISLPLDVSDRISAFWFYADEATLENIEVAVVYSNDEVVNEFIRGEEIQRIKNNGTETFCY